MQQASLSEFSAAAFILTKPRMEVFQSCSAQLAIKSHSSSLEESLNVRNELIGVGETCPSDDLALAVNEELAVVPWNAAGSAPELRVELRVKSQVLVNLLSSLVVDVVLVEHREGSIVLVLVEGLDLGISAGGL